MIRRLRELWKVRPVLTFAFLLACALTLFFAGATVWRGVYWAMHREEPVSAWMTVGYIGRSWGLDPREIDAVAGLPLPKVKGYPQPLSEIAKDRGVPVEDVIADVEAALEVLRADDRKAGPVNETKGTGGANP
jgi:hypothetical protein